MMQSQQILHGDQAREVESFMGHITPQPRGQDQTNRKIYREKARFYGVDHASLKQTPLGTSIPCLKKSRTRDIFGHNFIKMALISIILGAEDLYSVLD